MRIAMLGQKGIPATYGGIERYADEISTRLVARGHEVIAYCRAHYTPREVARQPYQGVRLVRQRSLHAKTTDALSGTLLASLDLMRRRVDVAHYHGLGPSVLSWLPRLVGIPSVAHIHLQEWRGGTWGRVGKPFFRMADAAALHCPNATALISRNLMDFYHQKGGKHLAFASTGVTLPPPPDVRAQLGFLTSAGLESGRYLLFVGRLVPEKGLDVLLEAYERLHPDIPLVIVGDAKTPYAEGLKRHASPGIRFMGFRYGEELDALYSHAYCYVHPSNLDGLALAILEAMAHNDCVLASDIPENVEPLGGHGYTFRTGDPADLADKLARLIAQPDLVQAQRAVAAQHVAQHYSWDAVVDRLEAIYTALHRREPLPEFVRQPEPVTVGQFIER